MDKAASAPYQPSQTASRSVSRLLAAWTDQRFMHVSGRSVPSFVKDEINVPVAFWPLVGTKVRGVGRVCLHSPLDQKDKQQL